MKSQTLRPFLWMTALLLPLQASSAGEVRVLTAGAFKQVVLALVPDFEKQTGSKVVVDNDTAGGLQKRIEGGEALDVAVIPPPIGANLPGKAKKAAGRRPVPSRHRRHRRRRQGRSAQAGREHGRSLQERAARGKNSCLYRSGKRR